MNRGANVAELLPQLAERVAPVSMAAERTLPVVEQLAELFPERGLVRGRVLACRGPAATSLALALAAAAVAEGAWLALVDVPTIGLDAAAEAGVALERVIAVRAAPEQWADVVAAASDGCEVIVARVPDSLSAAVARTLAVRLRQRGVVLLCLGSAGALGGDGELTSSIEGWHGIGAGHGHLAARRIVVTAAGRRLRERRIAMSA